MRPLLEIIIAVQNEQPATTAELHHAVLSLVARLENARGAVWVSQQGPTPRAKNHKAAKRRGVILRQMRERGLLPTAG